MLDSVEKDDNDGSEDAEPQTFEEYKQDIMSQVPFGGLKVATESDNRPHGIIYRSEED